MNEHRNMVDDFRRWLDWALMMKMNHYALTTKKGNDVEINTAYFWNLMTKKGCVRIKFFVRFLRT